MLGSQQPEALPWECGSLWDGYEEIISVHWKSHKSCIFLSPILETTKNNNNKTNEQTANLFISIKVLFVLCIFIYISKIFHPATLGPYLHAQTNFRTAKKEKKTLTFPKNCTKLFFSHVTDVLESR